MSRIVRIEIAYCIKRWRCVLKDFYRLTLDETGDVELTKDFQCKKEIVVDCPW